MKATIEFNLPEDQVEFAIACKAGNLACVLGEIFNTVFRKRLKYGIAEEETKLSQHDFLEKRDEMRDIVKEQGVEDLIL